LRRVLVLEPDTEGHSQEWLQHLMEFVATEAPNMAICLVASPTLCEALAKVVPADARDRIQLTALKPRELRWCTHRRLAISAFARWWTMRRHLERSSADEGLFLSLDFLALPLALGLGARGKPLAGILFRPSVHYCTLGRYRPSHAERLRDLRKDILYRLMLRNRALRAVLSLDPFFPLHAVSRYAHGDKVLALPDPAHSEIRSVACVSDIPDFVPPGRVGFLLFGHLTERKGPLVLLDALRLLPGHIAARAAVLFAGRIDPAIREKIDSRRRNLAQAHPDLWIRIEDRRLDRAELDALVARSHVVLAPYQRFVGSSGVLLWAARAGRPVLAQDFGLIGRLTRDHCLGAVTDSSDPVRLSLTIRSMIERGPATFIDRFSAERFADSRTPFQFSSIVLSHSFRGAELSRSAPT